MSGAAMSFVKMITAAQGEFKNLPEQRNVIVLHPQFRYHNALISAIVDASGRNAVFVSLSGPNPSLEQVWQALQRELRDVYDFALGGLEAASGRTAVDAFEEAVRVITPMILVLSAFDRAPDAVVDFVAKAAERFGESVCFVVDSRTWPSGLTSRVDSRQVAILPVAVGDMFLDYTAYDQSRVLLEVRALGSGQVFINGRRIDQWDGALPRALFFYFIDRGMTTRDEVFSTFWPELSTREATNVFHVTKRKISEILGVDLTVYSSGFYRIASNVDLYYDAVAFVEAVQNSAVADDPGEAKGLLKRAIRLHERDFLGDFEQPWAVRRREELRMTYVDALTALARLYEDDNRTIEALGLYNWAFGAYPQREDLARVQMRLYRQHGQPERALAIYTRLEDELQGTLGVAPSPETVALASEIQQEAITR
jgi:DNA-binding SARP family transcriptional activator